MVDKSITLLSLLVIEKESIEFRRTFAKNYTHTFLKDYDNKEVLPCVSTIYLQTKEELSKKKEGQE